MPIPLDCTDGFVEAYYGRPEAFAGRRCPGHELAAGTWDARHGALRTQTSLSGPLVLVTAGR